MALMRSVLSPAFAGLLALGLLGGCGLTAMAGLGGGASVDLDSVSRDQLAAFETPIMRATVPALGIDTLLSPRDTKGEFVTWESADGYTFTFKGGVLVETRGLGPDLMSASAPTGAQIAAGNAIRRSYFYAWENDANQRRDYSCTTAAKGSEAVVIYGRSHPTRHVEENCLRDGGVMNNHYWFEGGKIRQSQQWISPEARAGSFVLVID